MLLIGLGFDRKAARRSVADGALKMHPNQPHPIAAEATDEDDEEARAFYHPTHPPPWLWG